MYLYSYLNDIQKPIYFSLAHTVGHACNDVRDDLLRAWQAVLPETLRVLIHNTQAAQAAFRPAGKAVELRVEQVNGHENMRTGSNGPFRVYRNCLWLTPQQVAALLAVPFMSLLYHVRYNHCYRSSQLMQNLQVIKCPDSVSHGGALFNSWKATEACKQSERNGQCVQESVPTATESDRST